jgi:hypothetical protein
MIQSAAYTKCSEFYEVAKTVEFVMPYGEQDTQIRIEALHDLRTGHFSTRVYYYEHFHLQPSYPVNNGKFTKNPEDFQVWVPFPNPGWTDCHTADEAITQVLGFIGAN